MSDFILSPLELEALTGKTRRGQKRYGSQAAVLREMGIPCTERPDKTLIVYAAHCPNATRTPQKEQEHAPTVLP